VKDAAPLVDGAAAVPRTIWSLLFHGSKIYRNPRCVN
jgi:hypothetical protein